MATKLPSTGSKKRDNEDTNFHESNTSKVKYLSSFTLSTKPQAENKKSDNEDMNFKEGNKSKVKY